MNNRVLVTGKFGLSRAGKIICTNGRREAKVVSTTVFLYMLICRPAMSQMARANRHTSVIISKAPISCHRRNYSGRTSVHRLIMLRKSTHKRCALGRQLLPRGLQLTVYRDHKNGSKNPHRGQCKGRPYRHDVQRCRRQAEKHDDDATFCKIEPDQVKKVTRIERLLLSIFCRGRIVIGCKALTFWIQSNAFWSNSSIPVPYPLSMAANTTAD